jgi:hypothetical protein
MTCSGAFPNPFAGIAPTCLNPNRDRAGRPSVGPRGEAGMEEDHQQVKLLVTYDVPVSRQEEYYQFVLGEFVPGVQNLGLHMTEVWHTAYGDYPVRLAGFVAQDYETMVTILSNPTFVGLEEKLQEFVLNYRRRIVQLKNGFQW